MQTNAPNVYTGIFNISGRRGADGQHVMEWSISLTFQEGGACANYREAFSRLASMVPLIDEGLNAGKSLGTAVKNAWDATRKETKPKIKAEAEVKSQENVKVEEGASMASSSMASGTQRAAPSVTLVDSSQTEPNQFPFNNSAAATSAVSGANKVVIFSAGALVFVLVGIVLA
ncbi:hypothetical protein QFC20_006097 [Naganishia adeliensis]|uniref:Uncharacterized protein n=1 Tax=Naganishia adeliensis TaxID=92952 RepID=A0ACC2VFW1_9TREE|nr:hypothetical protein QFC20_006097 [Naganishia adeliensis]